MKNPFFVHHFAVFAQQKYSESQKSEGEAQDEDGNIAWIPLSVPVRLDQLHQENQDWFLFSSFNWLPSTINIHELPSVKLSILTCTIKTIKTIKIHQVSVTKEKPYTASPRAPPSRSWTNPSSMASASIRWACAQLASPVVVKQYRMRPDVSCHLVHFQWNFHICYFRLIDYHIISINITYTDGFATSVHRSPAGRCWFSPTRHPASWNAPCWNFWPLGQVVAVLFVDRSGGGIIGFIILPNR